MYEYLICLSLSILCIIKFSLSVCDPVMGDEGKLYVPPELVAVYREKVLIFNFLKTTGM